MVDMPRFKNMAVYTHGVVCVDMGVVLLSLYANLLAPITIATTFMIYHGKSFATPHTLHPASTNWILNASYYFSFCFITLIRNCACVSIGVWFLVLWPRNKWSRLLLLLFILLVYISLIQFSAFFLAVKVSVTISCTCSVGVYFVCLGKLEFYCPET